MGRPRLSRALSRVERDIRGVKDRRAAPRLSRECAARLICSMACQVFGAHLRARWAEFGRKPIVLCCRYSLFSIVVTGVLAVEPLAGNWLERSSCCFSRTATRFPVRDLAKHYCAGDPAGGGFRPTRWAPTSLRAGLPSDQAISDRTPLRPALQRSHFLQIVIQQFCLGLGSRRQLQRQFILHGYQLQHCLIATDRMNLVEKPNECAGPRHG